MSNQWKDSPVWRRTFFITFVGVLLIAVGIAAWRLYKPMRAEKLAEKSLAYLEKGEIHGAIQCATEAIQATPNALKPARAYAKSWSALAPDQASGLWEEVVKISGGATQDRQALIGALIGEGQLERAKEELAQLQQTTANEPETLALQVRWLMASMRMKEAYEAAARLVEISADNEKYWGLYYATAQTQGEKAKADMLPRLEKLKSDNGRLGLWARTVLAQQATQAQLHARISDMLSHPLATRQTVLLSYRLMRQKINLPYEQIHKVVDREFNRAIETERRELANYYFSLGDYAGVLEIVTPTMAAQYRPDLMIYVNALLASQRAQAVLEILNYPKLELEEYAKEILRARAYDKLGDNEKAASARQKAVLVAGKDPKALLDVVYALISVGSLGDADAAMPTLMANAPMLARPMYYRLWLNVLLQAKNTARVQELLEKMIAETPENSAIKNLSIYYSILMGKPGDWVKAAYQEAKLSPSVLSRRVTLALALYKAGDVTKAYEILSAARVQDWNSTPVGWQIIRAAIYKAKGVEPAQVAPAVLKAALPEEQALLPTVEVKALELKQK